MFHCPKCNYKLNQKDENGNILETCPCCGVNWLKFLESMANDSLWPAMVMRDKSDVICPKCGYERTEKDRAIPRTTCPQCNVVYISQLSSDAGLRKCPKCAELIQKEAVFCKHCHANLDLQNKIAIGAKVPPASRSVIENRETSISCPKCGSTQITGSPKGFSGVKALAGFLLIPGGILWGLHGKNKIIVTCLKCGNQWKPE